jgi:hypothetical protein
MVISTERHIFSTSTLTASTHRLYALLHQFARRKVVQPVHRLAGRGQTLHLEDAVRQCTDGCHHTSPSLCRHRRPFGPVSEIAQANHCALGSASGARMTASRQESASVLVRMSPGCGHHNDFHNYMSKRAFHNGLRADRGVGPLSVSVHKESSPKSNRRWKVFDHTGFEPWETWAVQHRCHQQRHES